MDTRTHSNRLWSYGMYILSLLLFGTNGYIVSHISIESSQIVLMRTLLGGIALTGLVLLRGGFDKESICAERTSLALGGIALGLNWVALFEAYRQLNVSLATLLYYVGPILVLLFSPILFREKLSKRKAISVAIVASGLVCISGSIVVAGMRPTGILLAMLSAICYALLIIFNKKIVRTSGMQTAAVELDVAFVVVSLYTLCTAGIPTITAGDVPYLLVIGLVNTGLAYLLYFSGLQKLSGQSVALISYIDPVSALIFSALLLHEAMTPVQLVGALAIIGGAMFGEMGSQKNAVPTARRK